MTLPPGCVPVVVGGVTVTGVTGFAGVTFGGVAAVGGVLAGGLTTGCAGIHAPKSAASTTFSS